MTAYRIAPGVAWVDDEALPASGSTPHHTYAVHVPDGPPVVLADSSWAIWSAVAEHSELSRISARAAELLGVADAGQIEGDVRGFLDELVEVGLLEKA